MENRNRSHDDKPIPVSFGLEEDWRLFAEQHQVFLQKWPNLVQTFQRVFLRTTETTSPAEKVLFILGQLIREDFMEILLLCGNGYGVAGLKILRGMYESAVTAAYLAKHPDEADRFRQYGRIHRGKLLNHAAKLFDLKRIFTEEKIAEIKQDYEAAKRDFQEPLCKKCKTTRTQMSWSRLDPGSMALSANPDLANLYLQCYFRPMLQTHTTMSALSAQVAEDPGGDLRFDGDAQRKHVDDALRGAHCVMLFVLEGQNDYFNLGLRDEIAQRCEDFAEIWGTKPSGSATASEGQ